MSDKKSNSAECTPISDKEERDPQRSNYIRSLIGFLRTDFFVEKNPRIETLKAYVQPIRREEKTRKEKLNKASYRSKNKEVNKEKNSILISKWGDKKSTRQSLNSLTSLNNFEALYNLKRLFKKLTKFFNIPSKRIVAFSILLLYLGLIGGVSVVGLLQSTERIGTSGIIVISTPPPPDEPPPPPSPPTEPTIEIDVYSDSACTQVLSNVAWGSIQVGGSTAAIVYIKNSGDNNVTLSLITENWTPASAENYMALSWNYDGRDLGAGEVLEVILTLSVSASITGINNFSFDIVVIGSAS